MGRKTDDKDRARAEAMVFAARLRLDTRPAKPDDDGGARLVVESWCDVARVALPPPWLRLPASFPGAVAGARARAPDGEAPRLGDVVELWEDGRGAHCGVVVALRRSAGSLTVESVETARDGRVVWRLRTWSRLMLPGARRWLAYERAPEGKAASAGHGVRAVYRSDAVLELQPGLVNELGGPLVALCLKLGRDPGELLALLCGSDAPKPPAPATPATGAWAVRADHDEG